MSAGKPAPNSSTKAMRVAMSPEQMRAASMHETDKAFSRYFEIDGDYLRGLYGWDQTDNELTTGELSENDG